MTIHYINLARRKDRDAAFLRQNSHLRDLQRVDAVDGSRLDSAQLAAEGVIQLPLPAYSPAAIATAMSHRKIWTDLVRDGSAGTIAEDDAVFNFQFEQKSGQVLAQLPPDWEIMFWGWNFDSLLDVQMLTGLRGCAMIFDSNKLGDQLTDFQKLSHVPVPLQLKAAFGLVAYSVSPRGAAALLEKCFPLRHEAVGIPSLRKQIWNTGLDVVMNKFYRQMNAYVAVPPLVWTENDKQTSDVNPVAPQPVTQ